MRGLGAISVCAVLALCACPPAWGGPSGTPGGTLALEALSDGNVRVSGTATYSCDSSTGQYCGWFPVVYQVPADQSCSTDHPWWVGEVTEASSQPVGKTDRPYSGTGYASTDGSFRMCLAVYDGAYHFVAQVDHRPAPPQPAEPPPPASPPPPSSPPPATGQSPPASAPPAGPAPATCGQFEYQEDAQSVHDESGIEQPYLDSDGDGEVCEHLPHKSRPRAATLSRSDALYVTRVALRRRLGGRFTVRRNYRASCRRVSRVRMRCRASWMHAGRWGATVTVRSVLEDGESVFRWSSSVRRPARSKPRVKAKPRPEPAPRPQPSCDAAYPTVCIPVVPYDLDCPEISYRDFAVPGRDPHGFDGDSDGVGCET